MANSVATVSALQGQAWAKAPDGTLRPLKVGDAVNADEVIITATGAHIELDFGDGQPVSIAGGQEVTMNRDLWTDLATDNQEAALQDESIQEALTALNNGEDLTEVLEETAAGLAGGGGGGTHDFVQLTRVVEEVDPLAFNYDINNPVTTTDIQTQSSSAVINQAPDVAPQTFVGDEDTVIVGQIIATDSEGEVLTYALIGQPANGVISINPGTGAFTYTPNENYNGTDSFVVGVTDVNGNTTNTTISLGVNPVNDAPVANLQTLTVFEDTPLAGQISATDLDGDALAYTVTTGATNGTVTLDVTTGAFVYTPNASYNGPDSFTVTVSDGQGGITTSVISVGVTAVNDTPVAAGQTVTTAEDTPVTGKVTATDIEGDAVTYAITTGSANGSVTIDAATGDFIYTPNTNYNGSDSFVVTVSDGQGGTTTTTISVGITPTNDALTAANQTLNTAEDTAVNGQIVATDIDGDTLAYSVSTGATNGTVTLNPATGAFVYTPNPNYNGSDSFVVTVADGNGGFATSTVNVGVSPVDDLPLISTGAGSVIEDTTPTATGTLTATDVENPALAFVPATQSGAYGSLVLQANGQWTYSLDARAQALAAGATQSDIFTVSLNDGSTTTVTVGITGTDDAPVISVGTGSVVEDTAPTASGTLTATDADNAALAFVPATQSGAYGSLVLQANGQWTYSLDARAQALAAGQTQSEAFTVTLNDGSTTTVTVGITGTDDAPVISVGTGSVVEDTTPTTSGTLTATDADNAALAFVPATQSGAYGSLVLQANGQ